MRGLIATLALAVAIGGLLLVIAYGASDSYLNFRETETDLDESFLLGSIASEGWSATEVTGTQFNETFVAPCLNTPLLTGVSLSARGAMSYAPAISGLPGIKLMLLQTSTSSAVAIMDDVRRDTESDCQRGVTVGTVERANVASDDLDGADQSVLVDFDRQVGDAVLSHLVMVVRKGEFVGYFSYETTAAPESAESDLINLAGALVARIDDPPTTAELADAGALKVPTTTERWATRVHDESSRILTASGRYPVAVGLGALGALILLFYLLGTRLSRVGASQSGAPSTRSVSTSGAQLASASSKTIDDYGSSAQHWNQESAIDQSDNIEEFSDFKLDVSDEEEDLEPVPVGSPPGLDFPQRSIEEKLMILKEARLKEPRREHRAIREVRPDVDWTEEISKSERDPDPSTLEPPTGQISRKALLKKLHSSEKEDA